MAVLSADLKDKMQDMRLLQEMYNTEKSFCDSLIQGLAHYLPHVKRHFRRQAPIFKALFKSSIRVSEALLAKMEALGLNSLDIKALEEKAKDNPEAFSELHREKIEPLADWFLKEYQTYRLGLSKGVAYQAVLNELIATSQPIQKVQTDKVAVLSSYLIMPIQRGPRFDLYWKDIAKRNSTNELVKSTLNFVSAENQVLNGYKAAFDSVSSLLKHREGTDKVRKGLRKGLGFHKSHSREALKRNIIEKLAKAFVEAESSTPKNYQVFLDAVVSAKQKVQASDRFNIKRSSLWKNLIKVEEEYTKKQAMISEVKPEAKPIKDPMKAYETVLEEMKLGLKETQPRIEPHTIQKSKPGFKQEKPKHKAILSIHPDVDKRPPLRFSQTIKKLLPLPPKQPVPPLPKRSVPPERPKM